MSFRDQDATDIAAAGVLDHPLRYGCEMLSKHIERRPATFDRHRLEQIHRRTALLLQGCDEQVLLVREIDVDRSFGDARARGDVLKARRRVAVFRKLDQRGLDDLGRALTLATSSGVLRIGHDGLID